MTSLRPDRIERLRLLSGAVVIDVAVRIWTPAKVTGSLFCLHGFVGTGQDFACLGRALRGSGIETIAIDMPGRGASSFLGDPARYSRKLGQTALDAAMRLARGPVVLAGSAWGGVIAATIALHAPTPVRGLILIDTPLLSDRAGHPHHDFIKDEALRQFSTAQSARVYLAATRNLHHLPQADLDDMVAAAVMPAENGFRMRYDPALMGTIGRQGPFDLTAGLAQAAFPILAVLGQHSHLLASRTEEVARSAVPRLSRLICAAEAHPPSLSRQADLDGIGRFVSHCLAGRA